MTIARYLAIAGVLFLAACAVKEESRPLDLMPMSGTILELLAANQPEVLEATAEAANALPFSDTVRTTFDGRDLTVSVARQNAATLVFDTAREAVFSGELTSPILRGHDSVDYWTLLSATPEGTITSTHYISWNHADPADYLAAGYWLQRSGLSGAGQSLDFENAELGVFIDGPELSPATPPDLPVSGEASYAGPARGSYVGRYGTNPVPATPTATAGSTEIGIFASPVLLTADFGAQTISGCMGCQLGIRLDELLFVDGESGERRRLDARVVPLSVRLLPASLQMDGTFASNVRIELIGDARLPTDFVTSTSGS